MSLRVDWTPLTLKRLAHLLHSLSDQDKDETCARELSLLRISRKAWLPFNLRACIHGSYYHGADLSGSGLLVKHNLCVREVM